MLRKLHQEGDTKLIDNVKIEQQVPDLMNTGELIIEEDVFATI